MSTLRIPFECDLGRQNELLLYVGEKSRYSTMTAVVLLGNGLLACANYYMRQLYLVEFNVDTGNYALLDQVDTCGDSAGLVPGPTDLMDARILADGRHQLLLSNFDQCSFSVYDVDENHKITRNKTIVHKDLGWCHGISAFPGSEDLVVFTTSGTTNPRAGIYAVRPDDPETLVLSILDPEWKPKDICFSSENVMFAVYCNGAPKSQIKPYYSSKIASFEVDLSRGVYRKTGELFLDQMHVDGCIFRGNKLYVAGEGMDEDGEGGILVFDVRDPRNIFLDGVHRGFSFPHGVDVGFGLMAVACYGTSDVHLRPFIVAE